MFGIEWLPFAAGLTVIGLVLTVLLWRRRGAGSGLKVLGVSLFPMAVVLIGLQGILRELWNAVWNFASGLLFSPQIWIGLGLGVLGVLAIILGNRLIVRRLKATTDGSAGTSATTGTTSDRKQVAPKTQQPGSSTGLEGMDDIEEILKRRGIN